MALKVPKKFLSVSNFRNLIRRAVETDGIVGISGWGTRHRFLNFLVWFFFLLRKHDQ